MFSKEDVTLPSKKDITQTLDKKIFVELVKEANIEIKTSDPAFKGYIPNKDYIPAEVVGRKKKNNKEYIKNLIIKQLKSQIYVGIPKSTKAILEQQDKIAFSIKIDSPLRVNWSFKKLNKTTLTFYLAPRVPEEDFEEDDEEFFYFYIQDLNQSQTN